MGGLSRPARTQARQASTGPRSRERGWFAAGWWPNSPPEASTGPRSRERGWSGRFWRITARSLLQRDRAHVSADGHPAQPRPRKDHLLQRDRAHVSADGRAKNSACASGMELQRDRAHVSADGISFHALRGEHQQASTGPRSRERGWPAGIAPCAGRVGASTGPRSRERGWVAGLSPPAVRLSCFNGTALT